ncbi:MAG: NAD+ synthase [Chloroflexi bacterium]|nr:NAD+ synthase [Chloroflexota bacterium]
MGNGTRPNNSLQEGQFVVDLIWEPGLRPRHFRLALSQLNTTVGDLDGNTRRILADLECARALEADLIAFPELALTGYPPEDLVLKPQFIADNLRCLERIVVASQGITAVVGFVDARDDIFNAAAIVHDGRLVDVYHKIYLPNYGVFDEDRYFRPGDRAPVYTIAGVGVGVNICEDIWYPAGPTTWQARGGAEIVVNINGSPYHAGKRIFRERMLSTRAADNAVAVAYVNAVGGQDELVFDGQSVVFDARGELIARGHAFAEDLLFVDLDLEGLLTARLHDPRRRKEPDGIPAGADAVRRMEHLAISDQPALAARPPLPSRPPFEPAPPGSPAEVYEALVLGTGDYVRKNGFQTVLIGLSGGIDSSLTAAVAADALGADHVVGVRMPSRYTSPASLEDAEVLARNLGIRLLTISIEPAFHAYLEMMAEPFAGTAPGVAEENVQSRIRGNILMALSNKFGWIVLTTGNKSEMATGYATLYGDMAGGFAVIKDVPKTLVYRLCEHRNTRAGCALIPARVLTKEPTAELRPGQRDVDSLPPYELLDPILQAYVEEDRSYESLLAMGFDPATVRRVIAMVDRNEYKRRQAPPGVKITPRAFGRDRRLPITSRYRAFTAAPAK